MVSNQGDQQKPHRAVHPSQPVRATGVDALTTGELASAVASLRTRAKIQHARRHWSMWFSILAAILWLALVGGMRLQLPPLLHLAIGVAAVAAWGAAAWVDYDALLARIEANGLRARMRGAASPAVDARVLRQAQAYLAFAVIVLAIAAFLPILGVSASGRAALLFVGSITIVIGFLLNERWNRAISAPEKKA